MRTPLISIPAVAATDIRQRHRGAANLLHRGEDRRSTANDLNAILVDAAPVEADAMLALDLRRHGHGGGDGITGADRGAELQVPAEIDRTSWSMLPLIAGLRQGEAAGREVP
jgi:hypothetical protein